MELVTPQLSMVDYVIFNYSSIDDGAKKFKTESDTIYSSLKAAAIKLQQDGELTEQEAQTYIRSG